MKAARWIIPAQLRFPAAVQQAARRRDRPDGAEALAGPGRRRDRAGGVRRADDRRLDPAAAAVPPAHSRTMAPYVLDLLNAAADAVPEGRAARRRAPTRPAPASSPTPRSGRCSRPQQQAEAMQAIVDLIALAGQQAQPANPGDRFELAHDDPARGQRRCDGRTRRPSAR